MVTDRHSLLSSKAVSILIDIAIIASPDGNIYIILFISIISVSATLTISIILIMELLLSPSMQMQA